MAKMKSERKICYDAKELKHHFTRLSLPLSLPPSLPFSYTHALSIALPLFVYWSRNGKNGQIIYY